MQDWILRAIDLANSGHQQEALTVLRAILQRDNSQVDALKWLAFLTPDAYEAFVAARHILTIDPSDAWARQAIGPLRARYERTRAAAPPAPQPAPAPAPTPQQRARRSAFPTALAMAGVLLCAGAVTLAALGSVALPGRFQPTAVPTSADAIALPLSTSAPVMVTAPPQPTGVQQAPLSIDPQVVVTTQSEYYNFEASDVEGIQQALYTQGPETGSPDGERSIAMTSYRIWMEWSAYETPSTCQLGQATIHLDLTYTYPRWIPTGAVAPTLSDQWEAFVQHVVAHEEHHGQIATGCAQLLSRKLATVGAQPNCVDMSAALDAQIDSVYAECQQQQAAFDAVEGRTSFPLPQP